MKHIPISNKNWRRLRKVRDNLGFQHYNRTVEWLLQQACFQDKNTITLEQEIFDRLSEIKEDNNCGSFGKVIENMISELLSYQELDEQKQEGH